MILIDIFGQLRYVMWRTYESRLTVRACSSVVATYSWADRFLLWWAMWFITTFAGLAGPKAVAQSLHRQGRRSSKQPACLRSHPLVAAPQRSAFSSRHVTSYPGL
jgi:hypothetical protein